MYPFLRTAWAWHRAKSMPKMAIDETHVSTFRCWPQDIDIWLELNNGRTLTLYDLGRIPLGERIGMTDALRREKWNLTVAGSTIRYRRRILPFEKFEMRSRGLFWDDKFFYIEQSMWKKNGECASHVVLRVAVVDKNGMVRPSKVVEAMGHDAPSPEAPDWIKTWLQAEDERPWPPMQDDVNAQVKAA